MRVEQRVGFAAALAILIAGTTVVPIQAGKSVNQIRYYVDKSHTRVVLDLSSRTAYKVTGVKNPDRIAINIPGASAGRGLKSCSVGEGGSKRIRVNRLSWGSQAVLDLSEPAEWKHFALASSSARPNRIVLDVIPGRKPAPSRTASTSSSTERPVIVVIDPGHGGRDPGTKGHKLVEKKLSLDLSKRIAAVINARPGYKAILTRRSDVYPSLEDRVEFARKHDADVFLSVHLNWVAKPKIRGAEVYFISPGGAQRTARRVLANRDRAADQFNLHSSAGNDVLDIIVDMNQQAVVSRSEDLAESVLHELGRTGLPTRAIKQKSFQVVRTISMPAILVEACYLSNKHDANFVRKSANRQSIANAIARGTLNYLDRNPPRRSKGSAQVVHTVKRGDTLWRLSRQYGISVVSLRQVNKLSRKSVLHVGQEILITPGY